MTCPCEWIDDFMEAAFQFLAHDRCGSSSRMPKRKANMSRKRPNGTWWFSCRTRRAGKTHPDPSRSTQFSNSYKQSRFAQAGVADDGDGLELGVINDGIQGILQQFHFALPADHACLNPFHAAPARAEGMCLGAADDVHLLRISFAPDGDGFHGQLRQRRHARAGRCGG